MTHDFNPDDWPNDYSHPNAIASKFEEIEERLRDIEEKLPSDFGHESQPDTDRSKETGVWVLGSAIAVVLSWSRNASILYCVGHGILSWIYVIYFAATRS